MENVKSLTKPILSCNSRLLLKGSVFGFALYLMFYPAQVQLVLLVNLCVGASIFFLRFSLLPFAKGFKKIPKTEGGKASNSFISIHVPICYEPPELVLKTLRSLTKIEGVDYEVLVLVNNTPDENLWKPIQKFCKDFPRLRFYNFPQISGFKAGVLNRALNLCDPRTDYVFTVDADYCLEPLALKHGVCILEEKGLDYLQFPQAYSNGGEEEDNLLELEYAHFFQTYMRNNGTNDPLLTGTLSFIKLSCLRAIGGWSEESLTEDAATSVRLVLNGYHGRYEHVVAGKGVMPTDLCSLKKQRSRWAVGNAQTLFSLSMRDLKKLGFKKFCNLLLMLSAWHDFMFIPVFFLFIFAVANLTGLSVPNGYASASLASFSIVLFLALKLLFFSVKLRKLMSLKKAIGVGLANLGLTIEENFCWGKSIIGRTSVFIRTNKFLTKTRASDLVPAAISMTLGLAITSALVGIVPHIDALAPSILGGLMVLGTFVLQSEMGKMSPKERGNNES